MKIFLSYSHQNKEVVKTVERKLIEKIGDEVEVFRDENYVKAGDEIMEEAVRDKLENSNLVICFVSNDSMVSAPVLKELTLAEMWGIKRVPIKLDKLENRTNSNYNAHFSSDCMRLNYSNNLNEIITEIERIVSEENLYLRFKKIIKEELCSNNRIQFENVISLLCSFLEIDAHRFEPQLIQNKLNYPRHSSSLIDLLVNEISLQYHMMKHNSELYKSRNIKSNVMVGKSAHGEIKIDRVKDMHDGYEHCIILKNLFERVQTYIHKEVDFLKKLSPPK